MRSRALLGLLLVAVVGCGSPAPSSMETAAPDGSALENRRAGLGRLADVALTFARVESPFSRSTETAGLVTVLIEAGLADLAEVRPRVGSTPRPPGASGALAAGMERWTGDLSIARSGPEELSVSLTLCDPEQVCQTHTAQGALAAPWEVTASILEDVVFTLGRAPPPEAAPQGWGAPLSSDAYAVLVAGRAAAVFYGALPGPAEAAIGDRKRDPLTRAVFLDPGMATGWWLLGRRALARDDLAGASTALARATVARAQSPGFLGDEAHALAARGKYAEALSLYEELAELLPGDPRFVIPHARAAVEAGKAARASELLDRLAPELRETPEELALRVELGRSGPPDQQDAVLARWQRAAPSDPEPVRQRIRLAVGTRRFAAATGLLDELTRRGSAEEADRLMVALGTATGERERAAEASDRLGLADTAEALRRPAASVGASRGTRPLRVSR